MVALVCSTLFSRISIVVGAPSNDPHRSSVNEAPLIVESEGTLCAKIRRRWVAGTLTPHGFASHTQEIAKLKRQLNDTTTQRDAATLVRIREELAQLETRSSSGAELCKRLPYSTTQSAAPNLSVSSSTFENEEVIPLENSCWMSGNQNEGAGTSPAISWKNVPRNATHLALLAYNSTGHQIHWFSIIDRNSRYWKSGFREGLSGAGLGSAKNGFQGTNSFGVAGYSGPCPVAGERQRLTFALYALRGAKLKSYGSSVAQIRKGFKKIVLAKTDYSGVFLAPDAGSPAESTPINTPTATPTETPTNTPTTTPTSTPSPGQWTQQTNSGTRSWTCISSSSDGTKLAAGDMGGYIYTSSDSGVSWTEQTGSGQHFWYSITSSSDGTKLAAVDNYGYIYTSTDSGASWTERTGSGARNWNVMTSSSDGTKLAAVDSGGYIYTSTDSGASWTPRMNDTLRYWFGIASSSDGSKLAATESSNGYIYTSTDSGATWTQQTGSGLRLWGYITSSSDGTKLAASELGGVGSIYTSTDSGASWTEQSGAGVRNWYSITSSSDGTKLAAVVPNGYIYTSTDSGASWTEQSGAGVRNWYSITSSSDGTKLAAVDLYGYIYTYPE